MIVKVVNASPCPMTRLEIARAIGRSKSPYLLSMIGQLVEEGFIVETASVRPNGLIEYRYWRS